MRLFVPTLMQISLSGSLLFSQMIWSSVGAGFLIYGKRQTSIPALICGLGLMGISYFAGTALSTNVLSIALITLTFAFRPRESGH
jgi:hypothetical protein